MRVLAGAVREARDQGYTGPDARGGGGSGSDYARGATYAEYLECNDVRSTSQHNDVIVLRPRYRVRDRETDRQDRARCSVTMPPSCTIAVL